MNRIKAYKGKSRYGSDLYKILRVIPLGQNRLLLWLILSLICEIQAVSCAPAPKIIHPKIARIEKVTTGYHVWVWYKDSWMVAHFKDLPDSIQKGKRITLYPGGTDFKRVGRKTRPW